MYTACMKVLIYHSIICVRVDKHAYFFFFVLIQKCDVFCSIFVVNINADEYGWQPDYLLRTRFCILQRFKTP